MNTVWDLGHRDLPEFVEITGDRHFEERELFFNAVLPKSVHTFVDTNETAEKIIKIYGLTRTRISVTGLLVAQPVNQRETLPTRKQESEVDKYFLYPAQYWPHKAHILLLEALSVAKSFHPEMKIVLTGSDKGNLHYVNSCIVALELQRNVEIKGFVSEEVLAELMVNAQALVFPSRLGPSNMPPLEALRLGTPIVISDVHFDTALISPITTVVHSTAVQDWADALVEAWTKDVSDLSPVAIPEMSLLDNIHLVLEKFAVNRKQWRNK
jgi:glycosyltransferase involved in cell wall biosynthesis